jgi:periplasmic protein TonB
MKKTYQKYVRGRVSKMVKFKTRKADLIGKYNTTLQISIIISLSIVIIAFKFFPHIQNSKKIMQVPQELFKVEDVSASIQSKTLPPPPAARPEILVATPSDEVLKDVEIGSSELDVNQQVAPPPQEMRNSESSEEPQYFVAVEEMPAPIGGIEAIQKNIIYPEIARRAGIEGTVFVMAYLDEHGNVVKTEIVRGMPGGLDEAAIAAVKMTKFTPGKQRGKPVRVKVVIPIKFVLETAGSNPS